MALTPTLCPPSSPKAPWQCCQPLLPWLVSGTPQSFPALSWLAEVPLHRAEAVPPPAGTTGALSSHPTSTSLLFAPSSAPLRPCCPSSSCEAAWSSPLTQAICWECSQNNHLGVRLPFLWYSPPCHGQDSLCSGATPVGPSLSRAVSPGLTSQRRGKENSFRGDPALPFGGANAL